MWVIESLPRPYRLFDLDFTERQIRSVQIKALGIKFASDPFPKSAHWERSYKFEAIWTDQVPRIQLKTILREIQVVRNKLPGSRE
jgi:hypothetical protein